MTFLLVLRPSSAMVARIMCLFATEGFAERTGGAGLETGWFVTWSLSLRCCLRISSEENLPVKTSYLWLRWCLLSALYLWKFSNRCFESRMIGFPPVLLWAFQICCWWLSQLAFKLALFEMEKAEGWRKNFSWHSCRWRLSGYSSHYWTSDSVSYYFDSCFNPF